MKIGARAYLSFDRITKWVSQTVVHKDPCFSMKGSKVRRSGTSLKGKGREEAKKERREI